jgi:16S rRNA G966 N2-methylase RsmD
VRAPNGRAYNRTAHLYERKNMIQQWSDHLDGLKAGAKILPFAKKAGRERRIVAAIMNIAILNEIMRKQSKLKTSVKKQKPIGIDLFAGAGGLSLGFEAVGFNIAYAVEHDKSAAETYARNRKRKGVYVDTKDINKISPSKILNT